VHKSEGYQTVIAIGNNDFKISDIFFKVIYLVFTPKDLGSVHKTLCRVVIWALVPHYVWHWWLCENCNVTTTITHKIASI
jgi:hypothetical protein